MRGPVGAAFLLEVVVVTRASQVCTVGRNGKGSWCKAGATVRGRSRSVFHVLARNSSLGHPQQVAVVRLTCDPAVDVAHNSPFRAQLPPKFESLFVWVGVVL